VGNVLESKTTDVDLALDPKLYSTVYQPAADS
jgi:hypothetical protein